MKDYNEEWKHKLRVIQPMSNVWKVFWSMAAAIVVLLVVLRNI